MVEELDSLLADLELAVRNQSSPSPYSSLSSTSINRMSSLTPDRPRSPAGSSLRTGPTYKTTSASTSYEVSRKYTENSSIRRSYGSDEPPPEPPYSGRSTPRSMGNPPISNAVLSDLDNILDDLRTTTYPSSSLNRERTLQVQQQTIHHTIPYTNGYTRDDSPVIDRNSAGSVSKLVADLEADLRVSSTDSLPRWKLGKEIKPITTTTFIEEKSNTFEVRPQPIISTPLRPSPTPERKSLKKEFDVDNLVNSISTIQEPELPKKVQKLAHRVIEIPKGTCCVCNKDIYGQMVTALGKNWHLECFTCIHCGIELGKENFFEKDNQPYCEGCYHKLFSPRCALCSEPITDKCVSAMDKTWHPECFRCCNYNRQFDEEGYHEMNGKAYCRDCYFDLFAPKCAGCNQPITDNYISALDAQWHPDCFVCWDCRCPFIGGKFFDFDGKPYCETHYHLRKGTLCAGCHQPIAGRCITAMFRKFHPEHFVCSFCLKQLNQGTFKEQNDKPYCHPCFDRLFS